MQYPWNPQLYFLFYPSDIAFNGRAPKFLALSCNREVGATDSAPSPPERECSRLPHRPTL
jgi:hypothetical protein